MKSERRFNLLEQFNFDHLDDPDFQEDSVREEIIVPILRSLGYSSNRPNKIIRSKKLLHPFVSIGSHTKKIHIIPDYLFEVNGRFAWILEAKAPKEPVLHSKHVEQAYSYAIHSEIRVPYFALCNGKEFVLYHISKPEPLLHFEIRQLPSYWDNLNHLLGPGNVLNYDFSFAKDFGLHLKRLGFGEFDHLHFPDVPIDCIMRIEDNLYSFSSSINFNDDTYVVTFDFDSQILPQLKDKIPDPVYDLLNKPFQVGTITRVHLVDVLYFLTLDCRVGEKLEENKDEIFMPLQINSIAN